MEESKENIDDLKEHYVSVGIENDEPNNEEMQKSDKLENLEYADGKERDEIDKIEIEEKLTGADRISPFGTNNTQVFKRKLERMNASQKALLANKTATRIFADQEQQNEVLLKAFHEWRGTNWGSTGGQTEQKVKVLTAESKEDFEAKIKSKSLSELQEMMMKLGFTRGCDRSRIISVLKQEYLKRG
jgi:hypothetical protein